MSMKAVKERLCNQLLCCPSNNLKIWLWALLDLNMMDLRKILLCILNLTLDELRIWEWLVPINSKNFSNLMEMSQMMPQVTYCSLYKVCENVGTCSDRFRGRVLFCIYKVLYKW